MLWLYLVGLAQAHVPHDVLTALSAPAALDDSKAWWGSVDAPGGSVLIRSDDAGITWQIVAADAIAEGLIGLARTGDRVVAASDQALWWTDDDTTWTRTAMDTTIIALANFDDQVWIGTTDGVYRLDSDTPTLVMGDLSVAQLAGSGQGVTLVDTSGQVWFHSATTGGFNSLGAPEDGASTSLAVMVDGSRGVLTGNSSGYMDLFVSGSWSTCTPLDLGVDKPNVVRLAAQGSVWLAANGTQGPYRSRDQCKSWQSGDSLDVVYSSDGGATSPLEAFTYLGLNGTRLVAAGWAGLAISEDDGHSWFLPFLLPPGFVRGLQIAPDFSKSGRYWIGEYASGVILADVSGEDFSAPNHGLEDRNVQAIAVDPTDSQRLHGVIGHGLVASSDGGENWQFIDAVGQAGKVFSFADPSEVWATGTDSTGGVLVSTDGLTEWTTPKGIADALGSSQTNGVARVESGGVQTTCVSANEPAALVCRDGTDGTWENRFDYGGVRISNLVGWPPTDTTAWLVANETEIWRSTDQGSSWTSVQDTPIDSVHFIREATDGTLVALTYAGHILRSQDGGLGWGDLGQQLPGGPRAAVMRPDFTSQDQLLVGTPDGTMLVDGLSGDSPSLRRLGGYESVDNYSGYLECRGCPGVKSIIEIAQSWDGAWGDTVAVLQPGWGAGTRLRADRVRVRGVVPKGSSMDIEVNEGSTGKTLQSTTVSDMGKTVGTLADFSGLGGGWIDVEVSIHHDGGEAGIDFIEGWTDVPSMNDAADTGSTSDTATDGGSADGGSADGGSADGGSADGGSADGGGDAGTSTKGCCKGSSKGSAAWLLLGLPFLLLRRRTMSSRKG